MNWWLITAYAIFFVGLAGYTILMSQRQKGLDRRLEDLKHRIDDEGAGD